MVKTRSKTGDFRRLSPREGTSLSGVTVEREGLVASLAGSFFVSKVTDPNPQRRNLVEPICYECAALSVAPTFLPRTS